MFEKSSIGAYWIKLYHLGERRDLFSCYGRIKANSAGKNLNVRNRNTKAGPPNRQLGLPLTSSFFMSLNDHHLGGAINFDYVSPPPQTLLKITMVVCDIILSF